MGCYCLLTLRCYTALKPSVPKTFILVLSRGGLTTDGAPRQ
ncbi:unnamed protein product [Staurois parvus]|uniref:Uncharacterized protein n=1 Tax=Staurois parvus TaxID=386267 RepID=A0ABN9D3D8_9NEOB|nr:unnamed protein product [Staurois parvus]